jgi:hypothetical protein
MLPRVLRELAQHADTRSHTEPTTRRARYMTHACIGLPHCALTTRGQKLTGKQIITLTRSCFVFGSQGHWNQLGHHHGRAEHLV